MVEDKIEHKDNFKWENGVKITWDKTGNVFISMPVNNIPKKQFDEWMKTCNSEYSGKRWDLIAADRIKAKAYDSMMLEIADEQNIPEHIDINPDGLLNPGIEDNEVDKNDGK